MPRRALARAARFLTSPVGVGLLALALALDACFVMLVVGQGSGGGRFLRGAVLGERPIPRFSVAATLWLVRELDGYSVIDDGDSAGELARLSQERPGAVVQAVFVVESWTQGPWAPWTRREVKVLNLSELAGGDVKDAATIDRARGEIGALLDRRGQVALASYVRKGDVNRTTVVRWGVAHDALAAGALVLLLAGLPGAVASLRARSRLASWMRRRCPECRYDLSGAPIVDGAVTCPECGERTIVYGEESASS